ncbi:hypothetical protein SISSUDRAFT_915688 [Sistotremastrum suecicum HHB10207 ss-3]|uniref:Uncharacterized protein n=1 Tax=Sistotremastrum suecicum HHB10207 ss-3 TaxID=1314776 RepID=A0A166BZK7_9AGAM|nr:hypothetical protein SISSUDRAFT_915688 [Sistotremastrum suecicum HHB10207 ss-3]
MELVMLIFEIGARDDQSTAASLACLNSFWKQHLDPILYDVVIFQTYNNLRSFVKHASILNKSRVRHLGINPVLTHIGTQDIALRECTDVSSVLLRRGIGYSSIFYRDLFIGLQPCRLTVEFQLTTEVQTASALWAGVTQLHLHFTLMNSTSLVDARLAFPDLTHLWIHIDFALTFLGDNTIFSQIGEEIRLLADSGVAVRISVSPLSSQRTDRRCVGIITDYFRKQDGDPHVNIDVEFEELRMYTGPDLCEWRRNVRVEGIDFWGTL